MLIPFVSLLELFFERSSENS